jgi:hypothetical protein
MAQLALDDDQRNALVGHLDRVSVPKLVWGEPATDTCAHCGSSELLPSGGRLPPPSGCRTVDDAQQSSDREPRADLEPRLKLIPGPVIHSDLAAPAALAAANEDSASGPVEVGLGEVKRLADPQTGAPQDHDQSA